MDQVLNYCRDSLRELGDGWRRFWFTPADPATLGLLRVLTGGMLFYVHLVWTIDLEGFFGAQARLSPQWNERWFRGEPWAFSYLGWIDSPQLLFVMHLAALVVLAMFACGLFTRITSILAWLITISYAHRAEGALFGLDQITTMLALYLMIGPSGAAYSLDRYYRGRDRTAAEDSPSVMANISIRLVQLHMCLIYAYAGWGKLGGDTWWNGMALWGAFGSYEYQSLDMTWLAWYPLLINALTHITVCWELAYPALVWPRPTRGLIVAMSIPLHLGIALCMGMITFGLIMIVGNLSFLPPRFVRSVLGPRIAAPGSLQPR